MPIVGHILKPLFFGIKMTPSLKTDHYQEYYCATSDEGRKVYFYLDIQYKILEHESFQNQLNKSVNIDITIAYLHEHGNSSINNSENNIWSLSTPSNDRCILNDSVMIANSYRSLGIGKLVLNKILSIAAKFIPTYSLTGTLGNYAGETGDANEENFDRRFKLYDGIGFKVSDSKFSIDKLENLNFIEDDFKGMKKIDMPKELSALQIENYDLAKDNERLNDVVARYSKTSQSNYEEIQGLKFKLFSTFFLSIAVISFILYNTML